MCLASKLVTELESTISKIQTEWEHLTEIQGQLERELNEAYHKLETAKFNACEGYYLAKEIQTILRKRRLVKDELHTLRRIRQHLDLSSIRHTLPKTKQCLNSIHKQRSKSTWQTDWDIDTYMKDLQIH